MPRVKLQDEFSPKPREEPAAPCSFNDLPDWFGRERLREFLQCGNLKVMELLNTPVEKGGIPCRRVGNQYRIIKRQFGIAWGFISENGQLEEEQ